MKIDDKPIYLTKQEALGFIPDRDIIHSFLGSLGAGWSREDVVNEINDSQKIAWVPSIFNHELAVQSKDGEIYRFDIQKPKENP